MSFPIRPGKVTCAGLVAILLVLPNSIWQGPDAKVPVVKPPAPSRKVAIPEVARRQTRPRTHK